MRKFAAAGLIGPPLRLHTRMVIVFAALTHIVPSRLALNEDGQPAATALPIAAPVRLTVWSAQVSEARFAKSTLASTVRIPGIYAESTPTVRGPPLDVVVIPNPACNPPPAQVPPDDTMFPVPSNFAQSFACCDPPPNICTAVPLPCLTVTSDNCVSE